MALFNKSKKIALTALYLYVIVALVQICWVSAQSMENVNRNCTSEGNRHVISFLIY